MVPGASCLICSPSALDLLRCVPSLRPNSSARAGDSVSRSVQKSLSLETALENGSDVLGIGPAGQFTGVYGHVAKLLGAAAPQQQSHGWQALLVAPARDSVRQVSTGNMQHALSMMERTFFHLHMLIMGWTVLWLPAPRCYSKYLPAGCGSCCGSC